MSPERQAPPAASSDPVGGALLEAALRHERLVDEDAWRRESDQASVAARYLACHPHLAWVRYPGLPDDPSFQEAAGALRRGFGPFLAAGLAPGFALPQMWEAGTPHVALERWEDAFPEGGDCGPSAPEGALALRVSAAEDPLDPVRELEALLR